LIFAASCPSVKLVSRAHGNAPAAARTVNMSFKCPEEIVTFELLQIGIMKNSKFSFRLNFVSDRACRFADRGPEIRRNRSGVTVACSRSVAATARQQQRVSKKDTAENGAGSDHVQCPTGRAPGQPPISITEVHLAGLRLKLAEAFKS
jgi:hypothetical protein